MPDQLEIDLPPDSHPGWQRLESALSDTLPLSLAEQEEIGEQMTGDRWEAQS